MVAQRKTVARPAAGHRVTVRTKVAGPAQATATPVPAAKPVATAKPVAASKVAVAKRQTPKKEKKLKVVRDSFTMPQADYDKIAVLKKRCLKGGISVKKSELLRAGLHVLERLAEPMLMQEIAQLENVKTGRPAMHELGKKTKPGKKNK